MEYRKLPRGTEEISVIGFGGSGLHQDGEQVGAEGRCVYCAHCDGRCPFHVNQSGRMAEIAGYFGM